MAQVTAAALVLENACLASAGVGWLDHHTDNKEGFVSIGDDFGAQVEEWCGIAAVAGHRIVNGARGAGVFLPSRQCPLERPGPCPVRVRCLGRRSRLLSGDIAP